MGRTRKPGRLTSRSVKCTIGVGSASIQATGLHSQDSSLKKVREQRQATEQRRKEELIALTAAAGLVYQDHDNEETQQADDDYGDSGTGGNDLGYVDVDEDEDEGEGEGEGEDTSLEDTAPCHDGPALQEARRELFASYHHHIRPPRKDYRTRLQRHQRMYAAWEEQGPVLVDAYLEWKGQSSNMEQAWAAPPSDEDRAQTRADTPPPTVRIFEVTCVDVKDRVIHRKIPQRHNEAVNCALIRAGFLGCSPVDPSVAISLECLELYHQIRRRQSSFSLQAMARVLCALQNVTYFQTFRTQLSIAFDVYLDIHRRIQQQVDQVLERDTPNWRLLHACPPCGYKLEGESKLTPERLHAMDGNSSLKRVDGAGHTDERVFTSDYHISPSQVDRFKDDVCNRPGLSNSAAAQDNEDPPIYGDSNTVCTDNWKAAHATSTEQLQMFEQTGVFVSACRHGLVESLVEMRRSGELAKYGLATLDKILDVYKDDQAMGLDIACSFITTVAASSIARRAQTHRLMLAVNAFHGFAHNLLCQLTHHPLYLTGFGLEDLETCERVFSASNAAARLVRHSSYFHWMQYIDLHYRQWDEDKYFELSKFMYNNYKQALAIIADYSPQVDAFKAVHGLKDADFVTWHDEQYTYLRDLKYEPPGESLKIEYVEALQKLETAEAAYGRLTTVQFLEYIPADFVPTGSLPLASQARDNAKEAARRVTHRKLLLAMNVADDVELRLGLLVRWTKDSPEYRAADAYLANRLFLRTVDELERLVVQRLTELAKANLMETGYNMRSHISKAIARRSGAVRTALDKYNELAPLQDPPRPRLMYATIASFALLGDFELLKTSHHDVLDKPWADPAKREIQTKYYKILRAHEEIARLNVEIHRLATWVEDEDRHLHQMSEGLEASGSLLSSTVRDYFIQRHRVNNIHRARMRLTYALPGYNGHRDAGVRLGGMQELREVSADAEIDPAVRFDLSGEGAVGIDEDDGLRDESIRLADVMDRIHL